MLEVLRMKLKKFIATTLSASILLSPALSSGSTLFATEPGTSSFTDKGAKLAAGGVSGCVYDWFSLRLAEVENLMVPLGSDIINDMRYVVEYLYLKEPKGIDKALFPLCSEKIQDSGYIGNILFQNAPISPCLYVLQNGGRIDDINDFKNRYSFYDSLFTLYWFIFRASSDRLVFKEGTLPKGRSNIEQYVNALGGAEFVYSALKINLFMAKRWQCIDVRNKNIVKNLNSFYENVDKFIEDRVKPLIPRNKVPKIVKDLEIKKIFLEEGKWPKKDSIMEIEDMVADFSPCFPLCNKDNFELTNGKMNEEQLYIMAQNIFLTTAFRQAWNLNSKIHFVEKNIDADKSIENWKRDDKLTIRMAHAREIGEKYFTNPIKSEFLSGKQVKRLLSQKEKAEREELAAEEAKIKAEEEAQKKAEQEKAEQEKAEIATKKAEEAEKRRQKGKEKAEREAQNKAEQERMLEEIRIVCEKKEADENAKKLTEEKIKKEKRREDHLTPRETKNDIKTEEIRRKKQEAKEKSSSVSETSSESGSSSESESSEETKKQGKFEEKSKDKKEDILEMIKSKFTIEEVPEKNIVKINKSCEEGYDVYCEKSLLEEINNMPDVSKDSVVNYLEVFSKGSFVRETISDLKTISKRKAVYRKLRSSYDDRIKNLFGEGAVSKFKPHKCKIKGTIAGRLVYFVNNDSKQVNKDSKQIYVTDNTKHVGKPEK